MSAPLFSKEILKIFLGDEEIRVTPTGAKVLEMLCREKGKCVDRKKIQGTIWGDYDNDSISHNLDVQIDKLRGALKADPAVSIEIIKKTGIILKRKPSLLACV